MRPLSRSCVLRRLDDDIYADFESTFPEYAESSEGGAKSVQKLDEDAMKSAAGKEKWRTFIAKYEGKGEFWMQTCAPQG